MHELVHKKYRTETGEEVQAIAFRYSIGDADGIGFEFSMFCEVGESYKQRFRDMLRERGWATHTREIDCPPYVVTVLYRPQERCGECAACLDVARCGNALAPNPPFTHAHDSDSTLWNVILYHNPCAFWDNSYLTM